MHVNTCTSRSQWLHPFPVHIAFTNADSDAPNSDSWCSVIARQQVASPIVS